MNGYQGLYGPMMRHGGTFGYSSQMHDGGTSPVEWAILGVVIAILVVVLLLLVDRCQHRRYHRRHGWNHPGAASEPAEQETPESVQPETKPRRRRVRNPKTS